MLPCEIDAKLGLALVVLVENVLFPESLVSSKERPSNGLQTPKKIELRNKNNGTER